VQKSREKHGGRVSLGPENVLTFGIGCSPFIVEIHQ